MKNYAYYSNISLKTKILNQFRKLFFKPAAEKFLLDKIQGAKGSSMWRKVIPPEYLYPKNSWRLYERNGIKMKLDISNVVDHLKYYSFKDAGFENFLAKLQPHFTILDIGGNIGVTCLEFAKKATAGSVTAFEPSLSNYTRLRENINLNTFQNIKAVNKGIGDAPGEFKLYNVVGSNPGMKRVLNDENAENFEFETIKIDTLQNQLNQLNIEKVHAIKIDVEGFEMKVLQSAALLLSKHKPILFIELDDSNLKGQSSSAGQLVGFLKKLDYKIYNAENLQQPLREDFDYTNCHIDIICE